MEPAIATAAAYGLETAIEGGVAGYYLSKSTLPLKGHLEHVTTTDTLPRSGHTISVISDRAYIFGGSGTSESESINNYIHELHISTDENTTAVLRSIPAMEMEDKETDFVPSARNSHSATVARNRIFIFGGSEVPSGKGKPVEENGRLWIFDPLSSKWSFLDPPPDTTFPFARKDHVTTSSPDGSAIFIHGGLSSDQVCLNDLWVFYLDEGKWTSFQMRQGHLGINPASHVDKTIDFIEYPTGGTLKDVSEDLAQGRMKALKATVSGRLGTTPQAIPRKPHRLATLQLYIS
ncbi:hypothetical protein DID88_005168 [Monilinia fructigena]|uniref:Uncharacterized protein n=1 Tax=Monilinia fructigena TaxID=38457 RepID=A0A395IEX5_9HELO|nr:hypothetical protein DID88_005168 [Monilinia fructigena]